MDWDRVERSWKQLTDKVKEQLDTLTNDDLVAIDGKREQRRTLTIGLIHSANDG